MKKNSPVTVGVRSKSEPTLGEIAIMRDSLGVYNHFRNSLSGNLEPARRCRLEIETTCAQNCEFFIQKNNDVKIAIDIEKISNWAKAGVLHKYKKNEA